MKILVDMNLSPEWAAFLIAWSSLGALSATDAEILTYAKEHNFTVFTNDLDFGIILAITRSKAPSVIQTRTGALQPSRIGDIVLRSINLLSDEIAKGALVTIDQHKTRVTLLPLF